MACDVLAFVDARDDRDSKLATLNKLRAHISGIQKRCRILEKELAAQNPPVGSIRALPSEILSIVFDFYTKEHPRLIRRLVLVCKQWHDVAVNNPQLWSSISILGYLYEGDFKTCATRLRPYIKACLQHSGSSLLHIDLDLRYISPWNDHMKAQVASTLNEIYPDLSEIKIFDWIDEQDWSWCVENNTEDLPGHYSYMMKLLFLLDSKDRWGSLKLTYPNDTEFANEISSWLAGSFPNLKYLFLSEYPDKDDLEEPGTTLIDLLSLESLKVLDLYTLDFIHPPSHLKHLGLRATATSQQRINFPQATQPVQPPSRSIIEIPTSY